MLSRQTHSDAQHPVPKGLRPRLKHQLSLSAAVREPQRDRLALFADKRLGKCTLSTEWVLTRIPQPINILIVAPNSSLPDWVRNLESDGQKAVLLSGKEQERYDEVQKHFHLEHPPTFFITNPHGLFHAARNGAQRCPECTLFPVFGCRLCGGTGKLKGKNQPSPTAIAMMTWDAVIWDESVQIRNPKTQLNKVAKACFFDTRFKAILTGDPTPETIFNIFEQMVWCFGVFMGHKNFFKWRHELFSQEGHEWLPKLGSLGKIKAAVQARSLFLTRKEAGVEESKTIETRRCQLPDLLQKTYQRCERDFELPKDAWEKTPRTQTKFVIVMRNWLAALAGGCRKGYTADHKIEVLMDLILDEFQGQPFLVVFRFNFELDRVAAMLRKFGVLFSEIRGGVSTAERTQIADRLRTGRLQGILCQIKAIKYGADYSMINNMFRFSLPHSYDDISQSQDRIVNTQKKDMLRIIDIVAEGTIDEDIQEAVKAKTKDARGFMEVCTRAMRKRRENYAVS